MDELGRRGRTPKSRKADRLSGWGNRDTSVRDFPHVPVSHKGALCVCTVFTRDEKENVTLKNTQLRISFALMLTIVVSAQFTNDVLAGHDEDFQLDGNVANDVVNPPFDWEDLFDANFPVVPTPKAVLPAGFGAATFIRDFNSGKNGPDFTTFATGSKDILNITGGWDCARSNNVNDKIDIINAYAAAYDSDGEVILYFAMERYSNEGGANVGVWFLQDPNVDCVFSGNSGSFTGNHVDGGLLAVAGFTNGGVVNSILVYQWVGGAEHGAARGVFRHGLWTTSTP